MKTSLHFSKYCSRRNKKILLNTYLSFIIFIKHKRAFILNHEGNYFCLSLYITENIIQKQ